MYKSVLLPEILEFTQAFFPSLIEQSYEHCKSATDISIREVRSASTHLCNRFQRVLALPITRPRALPTKINFSNFEQDIERLSHLWSIAAQEDIARDENPLSPEQILAAIDSSLQLSCLSDTDILCDEIEKQLELIGEGFYQKINRILSACSSDTDSPVPNSNYKCAPLRLDEAPTLSDAEQAIEQVKNFFDTEITDTKIGTRFHALCKKMYIPAINCALMSPPNGAEPTIVLLLKKIQRVGQFWFEQRSDDAVLIARAENTVRRFIKAAMQGQTDLSITLKAVDQIILEYHISSNPLQNTIQTIPTPVTTLDAPSIADTSVMPCELPDQESDSSVEPIENVTIDQTLAEENSEHATRVEDKQTQKQPVVKSDPAPTEGRIINTTKPSPPSIYKQAKHLIYTLLIDSSPDCLAHKLRKEWLRVLEAAGAAQGINSKAWGQAVDIFLRLTEYSRVEDMPISLAYKAQAQLKFASIDSQFFDAKTQSLKIKTPAGATISEGHWFDYIHDGKAIRCKLAAIIRQIGRFIFVSRQGQKVLEVEKNLLEKMLQEGSLQALGEVSVNSTLEDVLSNIKHVQAKELT